MEDKKFLGVLKSAYASWQKEQRTGEDSHPQDEILAAFAQGRLEGGIRETVMAHLSSCDACLAAYAAVVREPQGALSPVPEVLMKRLEVLARDASGSSFVQKTFHIAMAFKDKAFELLQASGDVLVGQEYVPGALVRSKHQGVFPDTLVVVKDLERVRMSLKCEVRERNEMTLTVAVFDKAGRPSSIPLRISLLRDGVELASFSAVQGVAGFEHLEPGKYNVRVIESEGMPSAEASLELRG